MFQLRPCKLVVDLSPKLRTCQFPAHQLWCWCVKLRKFKVGKPSLLHVTADAILWYMMAHLLA